MTEYSEFTSEWYQRVGSTIVYTMVLMVVTNPVSNLVMQLLRKLILCWDRGCSRDEKSTKKLVQEDYENVNIGNEFLMEQRYANILTVVAVVFLYSGGMPILYPVAACFFLATYWMDKLLLFRFFKRPIHFDSHLATKTLSFFKYIVLMHLLGFLLMFGLTPILPTTALESDSQRSSLEFRTKQNEFTLLSAYAWVLIIVLCFYFCYNLPARGLKQCKACCCRRRNDAKI